MNTSGQKRDENIIPFPITRQGYATQETRLASHTRVKEEFTPERMEELTLERMKKEIIETQISARKIIETTINRFRDPIFTASVTAAVMTEEAALRNRQRSRREECLEILKQFREAAEEDWDGEGGAPLDPGVVLTALEFVWNLPTGRKPETIAASPKGELDLDWVGDGKGLTIGICQDDKPAVAGYTNDRSEWWTETWTGKISRRLERWLENKYKEG